LNTVQAGKKFLGDYLFVLLLYLFTLYVTKINYSLEFKLLGK
jgi:hypothetical protein